ncbi:MAG TPA: SMP-30/gluconolactonase/LRE family protein [Bryobacteraceae bacterium]|nr:SMP-30/gluconolactonase/LRE family protein [Bryobacteraceae bacterium]
MHIEDWGIPLARGWLACRAWWLLAGLCCCAAWGASPPVYLLTTVAGSDLVGDGGQAVTAQIAQPEGLAVDSAGNLFIADAANHRVREVTAAGVISTVAGNGHPGFSGDGGPASAAQLNQPYDVALDAAGNLYIADYGNQRVRVVGTDGNIHTVAGNPTGSSGDGGPATGATLLGPRNLATDAAGDLYISEFDGHRVRRVGPDGTISTVAGTGVAGFSGDGGPATGAQVAFPAGLALDGTGNLYIVDSANVRIRKVLAADGTISTVCTEQTFGMPNIQLSGLAADPAGNLYIPESGNSFVWQLTPAGVLNRVAGAPGSGAYTGDGQPALQTALTTPVEVTLDPAGNLYISEARRVRWVAASTGIINTVAGTGVFGFGGDGGSALLAVLNAPTGLLFNDGLLYIADQDNQRVREIAADGSISTIAGTGTPTYTGDGLPAVSAGLSGPNGLAFDTLGNLYIADSRNNRVRRVDLAGVITTFAGNGTVSGYGGEGEPAALTPLNAPQGVAADTEGNVYISDTNHNRVILVDTAGNIHTVAGTGTAGNTLAELYGPTGLALDNAGNLYIADTQNHRIQVLAPGGKISTAAGAGTSGFSGDGGPAAAAELSYPSAVAVDAGGNLFIADTGNNRVRMVTPDGNIATIAGTGDATYNGDQGAALEMALYSPGGLALDNQGDVWVADTGNNRVRMLSAQTGITPPLINVTLASSSSLLPGPLAPGEIFSIFGSGIGPGAAVTGSFDATGMLSNSLGGVQVLFNGNPAPLFYVQSNQINAQVPYEMAGQTSAQLQIVSGDVVLAATQVALADANPALFTLNYGTGNAVVVNQDGTINSDQNPAPRGSYVVLYATGEGQTSPAGVTGQAAAAPFPRPVLPVSLTIADIPASILFAGEAPGFVGLMQINAQVPSGFVPTGDLPVVLSVGPYQSPAGVTIAVD